MPQDMNNSGFKNMWTLNVMVKVFLGKILFHKFHYVPKTPPSVVLELTNHCNLRCIMCEHPQMKRKKETMDFNLAKKIIKECADLGVIRVVLSRLGEPLLYPNIMEIIRFAKDCGIRYVSMVCNAMLLDEEKARELILSGLDLISFSIDAAKKETFERIRPNSNFDTVTGNIERFIDIRKNLARKKPWIEINVCLMKENTNEISLIKQRWKPLVERIKVWPVAPLPHTKDQLVFNTLNGGEKKACDILWTRLVVLSNGEVTVCCSDTEGILSVGNANNSTIKDLWNSEGINCIRNIHFHKAFDTLPLCRKCFFIDKSWCDTEKAIMEKFEKNDRPLGFLPISFIAH
jgi:MoaA/NifB/PqqE/SkfB family radical SAM enzyme